MRKTNQVRIEPALLARLEAINPDINVAISLLFDKADKESDTKRVNGFPFTLEEIREAVRDEISKVRGD